MKKICFMSLLAAAAVLSGAERKVLYGTSPLFSPGFDKVQSEMARKGFAAAFETDAGKFAAVDLSQYHAVIVRSPEFYPSGGFSGSRLENYAENGGTLFLVIDQKTSPVPGVARTPGLKGRKTVEIPENNSWMSRKMRRYCNRLYPPFYTLNLPEEGGWETVFSAKSGEECKPFLIGKKTGRGRIFLTSAPCGLIGKGWGELFFGNTFAESFAEFLENIRSQEIFSVPDSVSSAAEYELPVRKADPFPRIDGQLDDAIYRHAEWSAPFQVIGRENQQINGLVENTEEKFQNLRTQYTLFTDGKMLGAAFRAPVPAGMKAKSSGQWSAEDDFVELFIRGEGLSVTHLLVDCRGNTAAFRYSFPGDSPKKWTPAGLRAAVRTLDDAFTVELAVPLHELRMAEKFSGGETVRGNATREGPSCGGLATWAPVGVSFNQPEYFGRWLSGGRKGALEKRLKALSDFPARDEITAAIQKNGDDPRHYAVLMKKLEELEQKEVVRRFRGDGLIFWQPDPWGFFSTASRPQPDTRALKVFSLNAPRGARAIGAFAISNLSGRELFGTLHAKGEIARRIRFREVGFVEVRGGAILPDPIFDLPQGSVIRIQPRQSLLVWVDVDTEGLNPGNHRAALRFHPARSGFREVNFELSLDLSPVTVGKTDPRAWFFGIMQNSPQELYRDYGLYSSFLPHFILPAQKSGFAKLDARIAEYESWGISRKDLQFVCWLDFKKKSNWTGMTVNGRTYYFGEEEWKKEFARRLLQFRDHMIHDLKMDYSNFLLFPIDEPHGDPSKPGSKAYYAVEGAEFIRSIDPKFRLWIDPTFFEKTGLDYLIPHYDVLVPHLPRLMRTPETLRALRKSGKEIWTYSLLTKNSTPFAYRSMFWRHMAEGFRGPAPVYDLTRCCGDPFDSTDGVKETVEFNTIYYDSATRRYSVSRRMEAWYEGLTDLRLYHLAQRLATDSAAKKRLAELVRSGTSGEGDFPKLRGELLKLCEKYWKQ